MCTTDDNVLTLHYYVIQVLVVQERNGGFKGTGVWKLPTGVVDAVSLCYFLLVAVFYVLVFHN